MKKTQSGFSMIEVLVASTIMIMIVMMLGMLFQQSSQAWRTGKQRADTYQQVRAIFGSIQRDASTAVDQNSLPPSLIKTLGCGDQNFRGQLAFYTLTGTGFDNPNNDPNGTPLRSITFVTYTKSGYRTVKPYVPVSGGGTPSAGNPQEGSIVTPSLNGAKVVLSTIEPRYDPKVNAGANRFPAYVTISAEVNAAGVRSFDVGAASGGPDRTMGGAPDDVRGRDDIKTWAD
jgi:type II secretory pathway pseudopilin PulG